MSDPIITAEQVAAAKQAVQIASSQGYDIYMTAKADSDRLVAAYARQQATQSGVNLAESIVVVGKTYKFRLALKRMGLRWDAGLQGWRGAREQVMDGVPSGCEVVTQGVAAVRSMDHADSAY